MKHNFKYKIEETAVGTVYTMQITINGVVFYKSTLKPAEFHTIIKAFGGETKHLKQI